MVLQDLLKHSPEEVSYESVASYYGIKACPLLALIPYNIYTLQPT